MRRKRLAPSLDFYRKRFGSSRERRKPIPDLCYVPLAVAVAALTLVVFLLRILGGFDLPGGFNRRVDAIWTWLGGQREALVLLVTGFLMGHGERPSWVLLWVVVSWLGFALAYWHFDALARGTSFSDIVRHSASQMLSAGTAGTAGTAQWSKDVALAQSFTSYVLLALFLVAFVRKVSPR